MKNKKRAENFDQIQPEALTGDILHMLGLYYFAESDMVKSILEYNNQIIATKITSVAITANNLKVSYVFNQPRTVSPGGLSIDVDREINTVQSVNGDREKEKTYNKISDIIGSYLEGGIFEQIFGGESVSTIHVLNQANKQGIKIYTINEENMDTVLPELKYSKEKKQEFKNLINNGKIITIPRKNVNINGWTGTGYVVTNPEDGTGVYIISGGLNGGKWPYNAWDGFGWLFTLLGFVYNFFADVSTYFTIAASIYVFIDDINKVMRNPSYDVWDISILFTLDTASLVFSFLLGFAVASGAFGAALIAAGILLAIPPIKQWYLNNFMYYDELYGYSPFLHRAFS